VMKIALAGLCGRKQMRVGDCGVICLLALFS
jgi:hypothetical protein